MRKVLSVLSTVHRSSALGLCRHGALGILYLCRRALHDDIAALSIRLHPLEAQFDECTAYADGTELMHHVATDYLHSTAIGGCPRGR